MKQILAFTLLCLSLYICDSFSQPAPDPYVEFGKLTVISQPNTSDYYPLTSRMGGEEGQVIVRVQVDERGLVEKATLMSSSKYQDLDSAAIELSKKYQFKPYMPSGSPSRISSYLLVKFTTPFNIPPPLVRIETITTKNCKLIEYQAASNVEYKKNMTAVWDGGCVNGLISGEGILTLTMKDGGKQIYRGQMIDGSIHGPATFSDKRVNGFQVWIEAIFTNGALVSGRAEAFFKGKLLQTYDGEYKDGGRTGNGLLTRSNGQIEAGNFLNGKLNGKGKITYKNGEILESDSFKSGSIEGSAILIKPNGQKYKLLYKEGIKQSETAI